MDQQSNQVQDNGSDSLEAPASLTQESDSSESVQAPSSQNNPPTTPEQKPDTPPPSGPGRTNKLLGKVKSINIYLLVFMLILVLASLIAFAAYQKNRQSAEQEQANDTSSQGLNEDVLKQLRNTDVSIGEPKQILSVEANAVFAGTVLIRGDFETAGQIKSEGPISASGINVSGTGTFQTLQTSKLELSGDSQIQGNLSVEKSLSVSGGGTFGGTLSAAKLSIQSVEISGNLLLAKHIDASGGNPSKSNGNALGGGGTTSVSGTDTAGTININTGNSPHSGCFITVNFTQKFNTPHVVVTPVGSNGAGINYYVTRSAGSFSLCTSSAAPAGKNFSFDYIVID